MLKFEMQSVVFPFLNELPRHFFSFRDLGFGFPSDFRF